MAIVRYAVVCIFLLCGSLTSAQYAGVSYNQWEMLFETPTEELVAVRFDEPRHHLMFSVSPSVDQTNDRNLFVEFNLYGHTPDGRKVLPLVSSRDKTKQQVDIQGSSFRINAALNTDVNLYFKEPIIEIITNNNKKLANYLFFESFHDLTKGSIVKNPAMPECLKHVVFLVDGSVAAQTSTAIETWLSNQRTYSQGIDATVVWFNEETQSRTYAQQVEHTEVLPPPIRTEHLYSDWNRALASIAHLSADLIVLIADSPPNALDGKKSDRVAALAAAADVANILKANGSRIIAVGSKNMYAENCIPWFDFITSYEKSQALIQPSVHDHIDFNDTDYIILDHFGRLPQILQKLHHSCSDHDDNLTSILMDK